MKVWKFGGGALIIWFPIVGVGSIDLSEFGGGRSSTPLPPPLPLSYGPSVIKDLAAAASNDWLTAGTQPPSQYLAKKHFWTIKKGRQHRSKCEILFDTPSEA